jgi:outer membrane usher protein
MPSIGVLHGAAAASRTQSQKGALASLGFERQARRFSVGAYTQWTTPDFTQLGMAPGQRAPRHTSQAFMSWATPGYGSLGVSLVHQAHRDREDVKLVSANYGLTLGTLGFLSLSAMRSMGPHGQTSVGLTFTRPLADNTSVNASVNAQAGEVESMAQLQRSLPVGSGWGYRLGAGGKDRYTGSLSAQNELGTYTLEAARLNKETGVRAGVSGGAAVVGANVFASRRIDDSFAVVKVPDYPNVRVYADNHVVGKTGADGTALVPRLRPYQKNSIRLEQADLPLDAEIDSLEVVAVPQFRSGMVLPFPVKRSRGALISVILEGGIAIPAGAVARIAGTEGEFPSARNGEIYLHGLAAINRIEVAWAGQSCHLDVAFPKTEEPLPHLGEFYCKGVKP